MDRRRRGRTHISRRDFVGKTGIGVAALAGASAVGGLDVSAQQRAAAAAPAKWDLEADVVVIGSGACGLPAAVRAADHGASVIVVEANYDVGGHGMINGGQVPLGGGTSAQKHKILRPPFYAAWATPVVHDTYAGLRINMKCQVMDYSGQLIPGLYCGGESAGGCSQHGQGRAITQGYIAGREAAGEPSRT